MIMAGMLSFVMHPNGGYMKSSVKLTQTLIKCTKNKSLG